MRNLLAAGVLPLSAWWNRWLAVIVLAAATTLAACGPVECPAKSGSLSCGYCSEDRMTSSNPHAGMCTYCSSNCGADPCNPACSGGGGGGGCDPSWIARCGQTSGGIQFTGQPWPKSCGDCPTGSHYAGDDTVTPGGPYSICMCNGF
jgi:hypothetical protein